VFFFLFAVVKLFGFLETPDSTILLIFIYKKENGS